MRVGLESGRPIVRVRHNVRRHIESVGNIRCARKKPPLETNGRHGVSVVGVKGGGLVFRPLFGLTRKVLKNETHSVCNVCQCVYVPDSTYTILVLVRGVADDDLYGVYVC